MPRLTRTQKYANLREQLANDTEANYASSDLDLYQNRLNNVQDTLAPSFRINGIQENPLASYYDAQQDIDNVYNNQQPVDEAPAVEQQPYQEVPIYNEPINETNVYQRPIEETPAVQQPTYQQPIKETTIYQQPVYQQQVEETPVVQQSTYQQPVEETPTVQQPVYQQPIVDTPIYNEPAVEQSIYQQPVVETPIVEQEPVEEPLQSFISNDIEEPEYNEPKDSVEEYVQTEYVEQNNDIIEPVQEEQKESSYFDSFVNETYNHDKTENDFDSYFVNNDEKIVSTPEEVFDDVKDDSGEFVSIKERDTYLNQAISDVNMYNINNGQQTLDQLVDNSVDEIRHPERIGQNNENIEEIETQEEIVAEEENVVEEENIVEEQETVEEKQEEAEEIQEQAEDTKEDSVEEDPSDNTYILTPAVEQEQNEPEENTIEYSDIPDVDTKEDEAFSNTVSMEISKIMDEVANIPSLEDVQEENDTTTKDNSEKFGFETVKIDETLGDDNQQDIVEIKNISEIETDARDTMSSTIPFVVAAEDEDIIDDDESENGSNTVLNVILIILIVVLVAVLGLIVFYILKTKGIF